MMRTSERTDEQVSLNAEFLTVCAGHPVAVMVLSVHRLDETGQCAECRDTIDSYVFGYEYEVEAVTWPCATALAVRHAVLGWTSEQVTAVEFRCHRQFNTETGTPLGTWGRDGFEETRKRREAWVTSGIPAHRAVLYATADIALDEARTHEDSGRTDEDLDGSLTTLVGLL